MGCRPSRIVLIAALLATWRAQAGPLEDTLAKVYLENPKLAASRASLRAVDEGVPLARAGQRPAVTLRSSVGIALEDSGIGYPTRQSLSVAQSLSSGGETAAAIARAENEVLAGRARLGQLEQQVLLDTIAVFTAVARDQAVLERARENEKRLTAQLDATRDRLRFGDVSKTDLAQAEARQAGAMAQRIQAEGDLGVSSADYAHLIGEPPPRLDMPEPPAAEAESLETALAAAADSFARQAARFELAAAEADVKAARAAFRPHLALTGELSYVDEPSTGISRQGAAQIGATLQMPLYRGGGDQARLRQTRELRDQRQNDLDEAQRAAQAAIAAAFQERRTATARIRSLEVQADAAAYALEGVKQEALVGSRTVLDVLDAEAELFRAEVELIRAKRDQVMAGYRLRAAMGRLTAEALALPVTAYDPTAHYRANRNRLFAIGALGSTR